MTAGLETFAKVRTLHDRTDNPGEKAAAAGRMEALARSAGMTVAEALSKLDTAAARPEADADWSAFAEAFWRNHAAGKAADAPEAPSRRRGLPIYDPDSVEPWWMVAQHCLQIEWLIPKAQGGKFLTKDERARLKVIAQRGHVTNAIANWIETVLARCHTIREAWRDRSGLFQGGARPGRKMGESDVEWCARMVAAAKKREASKMDDPKPKLKPEPQPRQQGPAQNAADALNAFFNRPEFVAERQEREARRRDEAAEIIAHYGCEDAVFKDTPLEAALRAACEPLLGLGETWEGSYCLDGWGSLATRHKMPASVHDAVSQGYPLPTTVAEAWAEAEAADHLMGERCTVEYAYTPHLFVEARRYVVEELCNTLPARSLNDLRARGAWLAFQADAEVSQNPDEHRTLIATLRADIERMGARLREQGGASPCAATAQNCAGSPSVHSGRPEGSVSSTHPFHRTNADKRRDVLALIGQSLTDREIARRAGVSPTTVGTIRRQSA